MSGEPYYVCDRSQECTQSTELCQSDGQPARPNGIGLDGRAAIAASKNPNVQLDEADVEAAALAVVDLDSFPLEPVTSVQKSAVSVSSISNDASRHLNLAHGALQPINFNGSVVTLLLMLSPIRGCKF